MEDKKLQEIKARVEEVNKLFGQGSNAQNLIQNDVPMLVAEIERLKVQLKDASVCSHGSLYKEQSCITCFGDGTEEKLRCSACAALTWHRGGKCLSHDKSAPKPYALLKEELQELRSQLQVVQEGCSARVAEAEERLGGIAAACNIMRESLEYVRGRIGTTFVGESLEKIDKALSSTTIASPPNHKGANSHPV
ncbi:MAG TPA: hypothetical protein VGL70_14485 [Candidatus Binatia bacterium]|jgi:hypothetical protein